MKFMLKFFLLVLLLFAGVLIGMEKADQGMANMTGYENSPPAEQITSAEEYAEKEQIETEQQSSEEELQGLQTTNVFSSLGKGFAEAVRKGTDTAIHIVIGIFE